MAFNLNWQIPGEDVRRLGRRFVNLEHALTDFREPFEEMTGVIEAEMERQFATEGAHGTGEPWAPLRDTYAAQKQKKWGDRPILTASGALAQSLTDRTAPGAYSLIEPLQMARGTALQVGKSGQWNLGLIHQFGAPNVKTKDGKGLPARPILRLTKAAQTAITKIFARWFRRQGDGL